MGDIGEEVVFEVGVDRSVFEKLDKAAELVGTTRSQFVAKVLEATLSAMESDGEVACVSFPKSGEAPSVEAEGSGAELLKLSAELTDENRILRNTILGMLAKANVVPQESVGTPWGVESLLRLAGMWLNDELEWAAGSANHKKVLAALADLGRRTRQLESNTAALWNSVTEVALSAAKGEEKTKGDTPA